VSVRPSCRCGSNCQRFFDLILAHPSSPYAFFAQLIALPVPADDRSICRYAA
jgi:hypothetical protein